MWEQLLDAIGYLSVLLTPALLVAGIWQGEPSFAAAMVLLVFPLARGLFGGLPAGRPVVWRESIATFLDRLPVLYALALLAAVAVVVERLASGLYLQPTQGGGRARRRWVWMLLATCIAHELIHRRDVKLARLGHCILGLAGYPVLGMEHPTHHARAGDTTNAEWPRLDESVWQFAGRRLRRVLATTYAPGGALWDRRSINRTLQGVRLATAVMAATWLAFALFGGWTGFLLYLGVMLGVAFGIQVITYIQHWGLGDDSMNEQASSGRGWEDDCRFQAWITLNMSLHDSHHGDSRIPYYRLSLAPDSPRLPAGYVLLMVSCLVPGLWRKLMRPALEHWRRRPFDSRSSGRHLTCFKLYGKEEATRIKR
jgi:hypothetical protein